MSRRLRNCLLYCLVVAACILFLTGFYVMHTNEEVSRKLHQKAELVVKAKKKENLSAVVEKNSEKPIEIPEKPPLINLVPEVTLKVEEKPVLEKKTKLNTNVHIFYYAWYGRPQYDNGSFYHWNFRILPRWDEKQPKKYPTGRRYKPPDDVGANFFPQLGAYSSRDLAVLSQHMRWIASTGAGVLVLSWYPPGLGDSEGHSWDDITSSILDYAHEVGLKVSFHVEPYDKRSIVSLRENIEYVLNNYGGHSAFYYYQHMGRKKPLFYIYDSYLISDRDWQSFLKPDGISTIRSSKLDAFFIGLLVKDEDKTKLWTNGFDGFYTYFAADGFTYGSTWYNWNSIATFAKENKLVFIPSVGPGYIDVRVRPWNKINARPRQNGTYYEKSFRSAIDSHPDLISITSFNEWHEGTQIEPAVPKETNEGYRYQDYAPMLPNFYLTLTEKLVKMFGESQDAAELEKAQHVAAAAIQ